MVMGEVLSSSEILEFDECEEIISHGLQTFYEVGAALMKIRELRLYRAEYTTFELYCQARWNMTDRRARQMIAATEVVDELQGQTGTTVPVGSTLLPQNERQARELQKCPEDRRAEAWELAVARSGGQPSARYIAEAVADLTPPPPEIEPHRPTGPGPKMFDVEPDEPISPETIIEMNRERLVRETRDRLAREEAEAIERTQRAMSVVFSATSVKHRMADLTLRDFRGQPPERLDQWLRHIAERRAELDELAEKIKRAKETRN